MTISTANQFLTKAFYLILLAGLPAISKSATVSFTSIPTIGLNDAAQLSTTGTLVDAAHFGADTEADVTANGILFVSRGATSPNLLVGGGTGAIYADANLYQAGTHAVGYTSIAGLSAPDAELMFDSVVYGPGAGNSLITLSGLTAGRNYLFQLLVVTDILPGLNTYVSNITAPPYYGPYDWSQNAVQLITGTFTADATTQDFRHYVGGNNNVQMNAYQLRDVTPVPEPSAVLLSALAGLTLVRRRR